MHRIHPGHGRRIGLALAVASAVGLTFAVGPAQAADMKIGFVTINDAQHESAKWFAKEITKRTNGAINGRVFPAAQLGTIPRQLEGIQLGTQEAFVSPPGFFVGISPAFQAADAPGLFDSFEHQGRVLNDPSVRGKFMNLASHAGFVGAYIWSAGETAIASRVPIRNLADMKGKKIRVLATKMEVELMKQFGITGVPMPYSEVLPAIQRRVLDGARSAIVVMGPSKFYTTAKNITLTAGGYVPSGMWVSKIWLAKLSKEHRDLVFQLGKEVTPIAQKSSVDITRKWETLWEKEGGKVWRLSDADRKEFFKRARPLGDKFLGANPKTKEMYALLKSVADKTR